MSELSIPMVLEPFIGLALVAVLALLLRWTWSTGHSHVAPPGRRGHAGEYGLLVEVAAPSTAAEASEARNRLAQAGIRATVTDTADGVRVMVFAEDAHEAKELLHLSR